MESPWFCKKRVPPQEDESHQPLKLINKSPTQEIKNKIEKQSNVRKKLNVLYTNADQLTKTKKRELDEIVSKEQSHIIATCEVKPKNGKKECMIQDYAVQGY